MIVLDPIPAYLGSDFKYCRQIAQQREEALPIRYQFLPRRMRPYLYAIYAFMWTAYDFIGLPNREASIKLQLLDDWSRRLSLAKTGQPDHPIFRAMAYTFEVTALPEMVLQNILIAFRMDVTNQRYETFGELEEYCRFAVNPLGHVMLHLANEVELAPGVPVSDKIRYSDALCTALQLVCFWQNLGQDPRNGYPLYLPRQDMARFAVVEEMILTRRFTSMVGSLMLHLVDETRTLMQSGEPLLQMVVWPLRLELATALERGMVILDSIEANGGNTLRIRPTLTHRQRMGCLWRAFARASG